MINKGNKMIQKRKKTKDDCAYFSLVPLTLAIHNIRPHRGQREVAWRLRSLLHSETHPSEISQSHRFCGKVQDAYTLRCCPQVS